FGLARQTVSKMPLTEPAVADLTSHFYPNYGIPQCITVWFRSATILDNNRLQRTVRSAGKIVGANLPTIQDLYTSRVRKRAGKITADPSHPGHKVFTLLR